MPDISVIICTHNPRPYYLRRVLDALREQSLPLENWELLLVDNASDERLESSWDIRWHPNARHIFESQLGLAHARQRGICQTSADLLIFVDDDSILTSNYLSEAQKISREWPELGVWGSGRIEPEFELTPPSNLNDLIPSLALRQADRTYWSNVPTCKWAAPWGVGMCTRRKVARAYCEMSTQSQIHISGRTGKVLFSCEDVEIDYVACNLGLGMGIFPSLKLTHLIPKERVREDFLIRLCEGTLTSEYLIAYKWLGIFPRNPLSIMGFIDMIATGLLSRGIPRRKFFAQKRAAHNALKIIAAARSTK